MRIGAPLTTLILFGITLVTLGIMTAIFPSQLAVPVEGSTITPILLLELATGPQYLVHIFGAVDDTLRPSRIEAMNLGNAIDYLLMPAYGLFIFSFFAGVSGRLKTENWRLFGWLGIGAALSDALENWLMFQIVGKMTNANAEFSILPFAVWSKFGLLALSCAAAGFAFVQLRRPFLALLCAPAPLLLVPSFAFPMELAPIGTSVIALAWIAMAIYAFSCWRSIDISEIKD